jgi:molybdopterin/thiamine biosynthesis adenylyltransferase
MTGVGKPRVYKAQQTLAALNPDIEIEAVCEYVSAENIDELVQTGRHRSGLCL